MFKIRLTQMAALRTVRHEAVIDEMLAAMHAEHPDCFEGLSETEARDLIRIGIHDARSYGFISRESLHDYLALVCQGGLDIHEHPDIQRFLTDASLSRRERLTFASMVLPTLFDD